jgi:hypothetical protein
MKPAHQINPEATNQSGWHNGAGDDKLSTTNNPPPRSGGKLSDLGGRSRS